MNKTLFMALMLASGMALAQSSGGGYGSTNQSQPPTQSQPSTQPSQPTTDQNQPSTGNQTPSSTGQSSLTGCLKGSGGSWVLIAEGQSTPVTGDSSTLSPHNGHQVQLKGTQASDGSFQVTDVVMIAESCPTQQSDASSSTAGAAGAAVGGTMKTVAQSTTSPQSNPSGSQSPSSSQDQSSSPSTSPSSTQSTTPSSTESTQPSGSAAGQTGSTAGQTSAGQSKLPQTASPLPLLGLVGLGSLVTGLIARRKK